MKTAVIEAGLAQMVAIGVGAGVGKLMASMALSPWGWLGIAVVAPLLSLLYGAIRRAWFEVKLPPRPK